MTFITQTSDLKKAIIEIEQASAVAIDTEFHRETTYWPELCLVQLAIKDHYWLVDPLSPNLSLEPLWDFLRNPRIVKVFHAARQDLEIFYAKGAVLPMPFFDTQVGALALGYQDSVGYQPLVQQMLGVRLSKHAQITDWRKRPLSSDQQAYAADDVTYLIQVYEKMLQELEHQGRTTWVEEEMRSLLNPELYNPSTEFLTLRLKPKVRSKSYLDKLGTLVALRENVAQAQDAPRKSICSDEALLEWAAASPQSTKQVMGMRAARRRPPIKSFVEKALKLEKDQSFEWEDVLQEKKPLTRLQASQLELLKLAQKLLAQDQGISPMLLCSASVLEDIVRNHALPNQLQEGWRFEVFGQKALALLEGNMAVGVEKNRIALIPVK